MVTGLEKLRKIAYDRRFHAALAPLSISPLRSPFIEGATAIWENNQTRRESSFRDGVIHCAMCIAIIEPVDRLPRGSMQKNQYGIAAWGITREATWCINKDRALLSKSSREKLRFLQLSDKLICKYLTFMEGPKQIRLSGSCG